AAISNFEKYRFTLPASVTNGANILTVTSGGSVTLGPGAVTILVDFAGNPTALQQGNKVNLISTQGSSGTISGDLANTTAQTTYGATIYTFDIALDEPVGSPGEYNLLTATWAGTVQNQIDQGKAKAYLYGASARLTSLVNGADHMVSIMDNWKCAPETATTTGFCSFASMQGSTIKTRTGSSINNNGASFALGGAFDTATRLGTLTTGVFAEGGIGRYDSYSRFEWGDGDTWHYGIGAFAKHAFTNHLYLEGSARIGRAKADFDGKGSASDLHYNSEGNYWGAHAGVGVDYPLTQISSVDTYAKLLWTHQDSESVTTRAKERLSFDSADSLRSRIGTRYRHTVEQNLRAHVGVGWEYEFDGKARAKLDGTKIAHESETQGHSTLLEAGIEWRATKSWSVNANATAMGGQRKGLSGYAQATYRF
ncbi:MAG: autotransporter outer membrane beta-barrel domain-containing protein, partial [Burkholderiaceae bacterium]|nr:autotransporter outer membrane beta-barrel domain-containing protein [Burkholderiaceae bacterium]